MLKRIFPVQNVINNFTATHNSSMLPSFLLHKMTIKSKFYQYTIRMARTNTKPNTKYGDICQMHDLFSHVFWCNCQSPPPPLKKIKIKNETSALEDGSILVNVNSATISTFFLE